MTYRSPSITIRRASTSIDAGYRHIYAGIIWLALSIFILPCPAATCALLRLMKERAEHDDRSVTARYLTHLKDTWAWSTKVCLPPTALAALLLLNVFVTLHMDDSQRPYVLAALAAIGIPLYIFSANIFLANLDATPNLRDTYATTLRYLILHPGRALIGPTVAGCAVVIGYLQPLTMLVIAAPASRLTINLTGLARSTIGEELQ